MLPSTPTTARATLVSVVTFWSTCCDQSFDTMVPGENRKGSTPGVSGVDVGSPQNSLGNVENTPLFTFPAIAVWNAAEVFGRNALPSGLKIGSPGRMQLFAMFCEGCI